MEHKVRDVLIPVALEHFTIFVPSHIHHLMCDCNPV